MRRRYTTKILRSGQRGPYSDSVLVAQVLFEQDFEGLLHRYGWEPVANMKEEYVREMLRHLQVGFTEYERPQNPTFDEHFNSYLNYLREVEPGLWEFAVTTPFTD